MTISLGELIDALEMAKSEEPIRFDFCGMTPATLSSSRGDYSDLALAFREAGDVFAVELRSRLRGSVGEMYTGYKGGTYKADRSSLVWADNWGKWTETHIMGAHRLSWGMWIIRTRGES